MELMQKLSHQFYNFYLSINFIIVRFMLEDLLYKIILICSVIVNIYFFSQDKESFRSMNTLLWFKNFMELETLFSNVILRFSFNLLVAFVIIKLIYHRDYKGNDFVFTYFMFNTLIFFFAYILGNLDINMAFGFGLFAHIVLGQVYPNLKFLNRVWLGTYHRNPYQQHNLIPYLGTHL